MSRPKLEHTTGRGAGKCCECEEPTMSKCEDKWMCFGCWDSVFPTKHEAETEVLVVPEAKKKNKGRLWNPDATNY